MMQPCQTRDSALWHLIWNMLSTATPFWFHGCFVDVILFGFVIHGLLENQVANASKREK